MKRDLKSMLHDLYADQSKHTRYQGIPDFVSSAMDYREEIDENWRGDRCRYAYLLQNLPLRRIGSLADVGANTGFFALSLAHRCPRIRVRAYEPNAAHARFIRTIARAFGVANLEVAPRGVALRSLAGLRPTDAALVLNVLHHAGYDFDRGLERSRDAFTAYAVRYLAGLARKCGVMVFQMGSNWGGDKANPLVERDRHAEKLVYFSALLSRARWRIARVAYPTRRDGVITYLNMPAAEVKALNGEPGTPNLDRLSEQIAAYRLDQFPGEFYRRPMFVCTSRLFEAQPPYRQLRTV